MALLLVLAPAPAGEEEIVVKARRTRSQAERSVVRMKGVLSEGRTPSEALRELPGVEIRSAGGEGQISFLLIRGAGPNQIPVYFQGAPLTGGNTMAVDISTLPFSPNMNAVLYRGTSGTPGEMGIGGAMDLRLARHPRNVFSGRVGSFGTASLGCDVRKGRALASFATTITDGNYPYYDTNGTDYTTRDDSIKTRTNARARAGHLMLSWWGPGWRISGFRTWLDAGVPGPMPLTTTRTHRRVTREMMVVNAHTGVLTSTFYMGRYVERYDDPLGELGVGAQHDVNDTSSAGMRTRLKWSLTEALRLHGRLSWDWTSFVPTRATFYPGARAVMATRHTVEAAGGIGVDLSGDVEAWLHGGAILVSDLAGPLHPVARAGLQGSHGRGRYGASLALAMRPPSFFELYGDHGVMKGNPSLEPERALSGSIHGSLRLAGPVHGQLGGALFMRRSTNLIQFMPVSQFVFVASNIGRAFIAGAEAEALLTWRTWQARVSYTALHTRNESDVSYQHGRPLPGRPVHSLDAMVTRRWRIRRWCIEASYVLSYRSGMYLDASGRRFVPQRTIHSAILKAATPARDVTISLYAHNLTGEMVAYMSRPEKGTYPQPLSDYLGYPVPGRSIYLMLTITPTRRRF